MKLVPSTILRRVSLCAFTAVSASAVVLSMSSAVPANAATAIATKQVATGPINPCSPILAALLGNRDNVYVCAIGTINTTGLGPYQDLSDNSSHRVWLHQNANGTGWADCFHTTTGEDFPLSGRDQNPGNIQVVSNTSAC